MLSLLGRRLPHGRELLLCSSRRRLGPRGALLLRPRSAPYGGVVCASGRQLGGQPRGLFPRRSADPFELFTQPGDGLVLLAARTHPVALIKLFGHRRYEVLPARRPHQVGRRGDVDGRGSGRRRAGRERGAELGQRVTDALGHLLAKHRVALQGGGERAGREARALGGGEGADAFERGRDGVRRERPQPVCGELDHAGPHCGGQHHPGLHPSLCPLRILHRLNASRA